MRLRDAFLVWVWVVPVEGLKFILQALPENDSCGGCSVPYLLRGFLELFGASARTLVWANGCSHVDNCISTIHGPIPEMLVTEVLINSYVDEDTIVIYGEGVRGNPFRARHVVRWILAPPWIWASIGLSDNFKTWEPGDVVVHWTTFSSLIPDKNILYFPFEPPGGKYLWRSGNLTRSGVCFTVRKGKYFHSKRNLSLLMKQDRQRFGSMLRITHQSISELREIFQRVEYFISYDPFTHLTILAALCGCIPVVRPLAGISKPAWLEQTVGSLLRHLRASDLAGVAYDWSDVPHAKRTLVEVSQQQEASRRYGYLTVLRFLQEMESMMEHNKTSYLKVRDLFPFAV